MEKIKPAPRLFFQAILINVKMPTIVGILTFICMINTTSESFEKKNSLWVSVFYFMSS